MKQITITREEFRRTMTSKAMELSKELSKDGDTGAGIAIMFAIVPVLAKAEEEFFGKLDDEYDQA